MRPLEQALNVQLRDRDARLRRLTRLRGSMCELAYRCNRDVDFLAFQK